MSNRRQFVGGGAAIAATSLLTAASAAERTAHVPGRGARAARLFIYQRTDPDAIEAGRVMADQGVSVFGLDASDPGLLEETLNEFWSHESTPVVGLTDEAGFRYVQSLARQSGLRNSHSAPAGQGTLVHWIVDPA